MVWEGRWEGDSGWGTCVHQWRIHVDVWQNQYNIVKLNKIKKKKLKKIKINKQQQQQQQNPFQWTNYFCYQKARKKKKKNLHRYVSGLTQITPTVASPRITM